MTQGKNEMYEPVIKDRTKDLWKIIHDFENELLKAGLSADNVNYDELAKARGRMLNKLKQL
jgi:hypothetical protein